MTEASPPTASSIPVENVLREELEHGDSVLGTITPILGHLVISSQNSLFSDEVVAHVRGMASSLATQLLNAEWQAASDESGVAQSLRLAELTSALLANDGLLSHCHALSVERRLTDHLYDRSSIDPVLSPMLQAVIASSEPEKAEVAMSVLAAQARYLQQQRRMELPLKELPGDLFHEAILIWRNHASTRGEDITTKAETSLRSVYNEAASRLGLLTRLVSGMGSGARAALSISHAGVAIFVSALSHMARQPREIAVLATDERQLGRFALSLRAAGLKPDEVEEQFLIIHPQVSLPEGFEQLRVDRAKEMLAGSGNYLEGQGA